MSTQRCPRAAAALENLGNLYCKCIATMRVRVNSFRTVVAAILITAASAAQAVMYRWIDQNGSVVYSDQPPANSAAVRELTVIDGPVPMSSHEKRTLEILQSERNGVNTDVRSDAQAFPGGRDGQSESGSRDVLNRELEPEPPRAYVRPSRPEAAQDPCLRSSDPKCYEKNRNAYVPGLGYSPSAARARSDFPAGTGGTSGLGAGGFVGGTAGAVPPATTPTHRTPALPLRHSLKDAKDLK